MISISTLWAVVIAAIGLVMTVMNIIDKSMTFKERAKKPDEEQNMRIKTLEDDVASLHSQLLTHERFFTADKEQIEEIKTQMQKSNTVILRSLQALIAHSISGDSIDSLKHSKEELDDYLLKR